MGITTQLWTPLCTADLLCDPEQVPPPFWSLFPFCQSGSSVGKESAAVYGKAWSNCQLLPCDRLTQNLVAYSSNLIAYDSVIQAGLSWAIMLASTGSHLCGTYRAP